MAGTDIAIDLGSANFRLYVDGKGVVVDEPNVIAVDEDSNRVVAVGRRAYKMLGRTSDRVRVVKPVTGGVIPDLTLMDATLQHYLKKVTNSRVFMPRAVVAVPSGITEVERRAVVDAVAANGIRKVCLIEAPVAAAIGAGLDISRPHGSMVVTLGEGVSDIGVLSMNRLSASGSIAVGGAVFNEDIIKYARRKFDLIIGEQTAEAAKCAVGCAFPLKDIEKYELRGRDERNGLPAKVEVTSDEIGEAMLESVVKVVHKIQSGLRQNGKSHPHRQCRQKRNTQQRFHGALQFLRIPRLECPCHARQRADPERLRYAWHEQKEGQRHIVAAEKVVRHGFRHVEIPFGDRASVHGKQRCGVCLHGIGDTRLQK